MWLLQVSINSLLYCAVRRIRLEAEDEAIGVIKTPIIGNTPEVAAKIQEKLEAAGKKMGLPEHVADVVIFLLSDASAWMTGQVLSINGGSD